MIYGNITYLKCEFSGGSEDDGLNLAAAQESVLSKIFNDGQAEGERLAGASEVPRDHIFSIVDIVEAVLLDGEQVDDALCLQFLGSPRGDLGEVLELGLLGNGILFGARVSLLQTSQAVLLDLLVLVGSTRSQQSLLIVCCASSRLSLSCKNSCELAVSLLVTLSYFCNNHQMLN